MEDTEGTVAGSETTEEQTTLTAAPVIAEGTDPNTEATAENQSEADEGEDPIEALVAERVRLATAEKLKDLETAAFEAAQARVEAARRGALEDAQRKTMNDSFAEAIKAARQGLQNIKYYTADGQEAGFPDELIEQIVVAPFQKHNASVQQTVSSAERMAAMVALGEAAMAALPEPVRDDFAKKADGKPLDVWLKTLAETAAPETEYVKKLKDEEKARLLAAEARGYAKGQKTPSGTPRVVGSERQVAAGQVDLTTQTGIARALANGDIDDAKYRELRYKLSHS